MLEIGEDQRSYFRYRVIAGVRRFRKKYIKVSGPVMISEIAVCYAGIFK